MMFRAMREAGYRSAETAITEQFRERRLEIERLRALSPLRRAILPPGTVLEIDRITSRIDALLGHAPAPEVVAMLDDLAGQLAAVVARAEAEAERIRRRPRELPWPPAPTRFAFGTHRRTFSVERSFREQLRDAKEVREHGVGMLARLERDGKELVLVARGRATDNPVSPKRKIDCMLRTTAPRGPGLHLEPRSMLRRLVPPRDAVAIEPAFDRAYVVKGNTPVVRALLDAGCRELLLSIANEIRALWVGGGVIDLAWRRPFAKETVVLPDEALSIVTSIAERLDAD